MDDRSALLAGIAAAPDDDLPRLVYADWLDDHGATDLDRATAEFVRLSCNRDAGKKRQTAAEGRWLDANWRRLVPLLAADKYQFRRRTGRHILTYKEETLVNLATGRFVNFNRWCELTFWRGFVSEASTYQPRDIDALRRVVETQPLAVLDVDEGVYVYTGQAVIYQHHFNLAHTPNDVFRRVNLPTEMSEFTNSITKVSRSLPGDGTAGHSARARKALSDALRGWALATPLSG